MTDPSARAGPVRALELGLLLALVAFGAALRLEGVARMPLFGDELHAVRQLERGWWALFAGFDLYGSHAPLPLLQKASQALLGSGVWTLRLPALVPGLLTLPLAWWLARRLVGPAPALLALALLAASPMHVYYSRFARPYALMVLLCLGLVAGLERAATSERPARWWVLAGACAALAPWVQLASAGFVAALGLAALGLALRGGGLRAARAPLACFGLAALACLLLFLPARAELAAYLEKITREGRAGGPRSLFELPLLVAGGRAEAWAWIALALGWPALARAHGRAALWIAAAVVGPCAFLLASRPHGMGYAWSRYLLAAQPFLCMLVAWSPVALARRLAPGRALAAPVAAGLGLAVVALSYALGPIAQADAREGEVGNSYLRMHALPAFDEPWPGASPFYGELAADASARCIVELPPLRNRAVLLYRNHRLRHGKRMLVGLDQRAVAERLGAPYVFAGGRAVGAPGEVDWLVLHKDVAAEIERYLRFVYDDAWPRVGGEPGLMERHREVFEQPGDASALVARLRARFGPPDYEDEALVAWHLGARAAQ